MKKLDLEEDDVSGCIQFINTPAGRNCSFVFFDRTPGGSGHMRRLQDETKLNRAIDRAENLMKRCTCGGSERYGRICDETFCEFDVDACPGIPASRLCGAGR